MKKYKLTRLDPKTKKPLGHGDVIVTEQEMTSIMKSSYGKLNFTAEPKAVSSSEEDAPKAGRASNRDKASENIAD